MAVQAEPYRWPFPGSRLEPTNTALIIIDMQVSGSASRTAGRSISTACCSWVCPLLPRAANKSSLLLLPCSPRSSTHPCCLHVVSLQVDFCGKVGLRKGGTRGGGAAAAGLHCQSCLLVAVTDCAGPHHHSFPLCPAGRLCGPDGLRCCGSGSAHPAHQVRLAPPQPPPATLCLPALAQHAAHATGTQTAAPPHIGHGTRLLRHCCHAPPLATPCPQARAGSLPPARLPHHPHAGGTPPRPQVPPRPPHACLGLAGVRSAP